MKNAPLDALKYHVTGAIERGEKVAIEEKREAAKQYLDQRGINRAKPQCRHRYDATRHQAPPRFDVSRSSNPVKVPGDE